VRVAALYDVHGNLPALEAVLRELEEAEAIVVGGDVVGGAFPRETLELLRGLGDRARWIRGNAERWLGEAPGPGERTPPAEELEQVRAALPPGDRAWLHGLPARLELDVEGLGRVLFCHATPHNDVDIVTPLTPDDRLAAILDGVRADVVVAGHTHIQQDRRVGGVRWVNAGSVGMPYEDEPGAFWALLGPDVELRRSDYDRAELAGYDYPQASRREAAEYFESVA
jgi:putative phosphoesterase